MPRDIYEQVPPQCCVMTMMMRLTMMSMVVALSLILPPPLSAQMTAHGMATCKYIVADPVRPSGLPDTAGSLSLSGLTPTSRCPQGETIATGYRANPDGDGECSNSGGAWCPQCLRICSTALC